MRARIDAKYFEESTIEIKDRIFTVDERQSTYEKIQKMFEKNGKGFSGESLKEFYAIVMGNEAADWIIESDFSMKVHTELMCQILAIYRDVDPVTIRDSLFREQRKK